MKKQLKIWTLHSLIVLPILVFTLTTSQPSLTASPLPIYKVYGPCDTSVNGEDEKDRELAGWICEMYMNAMFESYYYHFNFTHWAKNEKKDRELVEMADLYNPFGCDVRELTSDEFVDLFLDYMSGREDEMEDSFFNTIHYITKPYCRQLKNSKVEFYLEEDRYKSKS